MHLLLFYPGVGFGADYWTPLHFACLRGSQRTVGLLVGVGASIEEKTICFFLQGNDGLYPIHLACFSKAKSVVTFLLDMGANMNEKTSSGLIPSHFAYVMRADGVLELLQSRGAIVQRPSKEQAFQIVKIFEGLHAV